MRLICYIYAIISVIVGAIIGAVMAEHGVPNPWLLPSVVWLLGFAWACIPEVK